MGGSCCRGKGGGWSPQAPTLVSLAVPVPGWHRCVARGAQPVGLQGEARALLLQAKHPFHCCPKGRCILNHAAAALHFVRASAPLEVLSMLKHTKGWVGCCAGRSAPGIGRQQVPTRRGLMPLGPSTNLLRYWSAFNSERIENPGASELVRNLGPASSPLLRAGQRSHGNDHNLGESRHAQTAFRPRPRPVRHGPRQSDRLRPGLTCRWAPA